MDFEDYIEQLKEESRERNQTINVGDQIKLVITTVGYPIGDKGTVVSIDPKYKTYGIIFHQNRDPGLPLQTWNLQGYEFEKVEA